MQFTVECLSRPTSELCIWA